MSELTIHNQGTTFFQISSIFLVLTGNQLFWALPVGSPEQCKSTKEGAGVDARDYTPYSYMLMGLMVATSLSVIFFIRADLLRTAEDQKRSKIESENSSAFHPIDWIQTDQKPF